MPITEFLNGYDPDPETRRIMGLAFEWRASPFGWRIAAISQMRSSPAGSSGS
jgi:hypothetical protein